MSARKDRKRAERAERRRRGEAEVAERAQNAEREQVAEPAPDTHDADVAHRGDRSLPGAARSADAAQFGPRPRTGHADAGPGAGQVRPGGGRSDARPGATRARTGPGAARVHPGPEALRAGARPGGAQPGWSGTQGQPGAAGTQAPSRPGVTQHDARPGGTQPRSGHGGTQLRQRPGGTQIQTQAHPQPGTTPTHPQPGGADARTDPRSGGTQTQARPGGTQTDSDATPTRPRPRGAAAGGAESRGAADRARTPEEAFDALYVGCAGALLRQVELLTGDPVFAGHAVTRAFDLAWQRWPEVARDSDPVGWVRAAAYEYALAPWQRWVPGAAHRLQPRKPEDSLEAALLDLPPAHRRVVMLHDGLGLDVPEAAAEVEASTVSTAARITHAHEALTAALPEPASPLPVRLGALLDGETGPPLEPAGVREASERGVRRRTAGAFGLTGLIAAATLTVVLAGPGTGRHATPPESPAPAASSPHAANAPAYAPEFTPEPPAASTPGFVPPSAPLVTPAADADAATLPAGPPWAPLRPAAATPPATPPTPAMPTPVPVPTPPAAHAAGVPRTPAHHPATTHGASPSP